MSRLYDESLCSDYAATRSTQISKEHNEIVNKAMALNEIIIQDKMHANYRPDRMGTVLRGLEFSEKTVEDVVGAGMSLSESVVGGNGFLGNYTAATLNIIAQEVGSSNKSETVLSLAFPDKAAPQYKVILDRIAGNSGMLPEYGGDSSALAAINPLDTHGVEYQSGLYAGRIIITAKHILMDRKRGQAALDQRGIGQLVAYNTNYIVNQAVTRKKYLLSQAVFNNGFSYAGGTINSNIPVGNFIQMSEPLGKLNTDGTVVYNTSLTYNPFVQLNSILSNPIFIKYRQYIKGLVVNGADLQAIMNHPNVKAVSNMMVMGSASLGSRKLSVQMGELTKELNAYYAPGFDFPLLADDDAWVGQDTYGSMDNLQQNFFVPRGKVYVLLDLTSTGGQAGAFHLTLNELDPNVDTPTMGLFSGVFARNLNNSDTSNRLDIVAGLAGAPAVYMPEAQFVLTGLYS